MVVLDKSTKKFDQSEAVNTKATKCKSVGPNLAIFEVGTCFKNIFRVSHTDKQLSFSMFCSISSLSYLSRWVGEWAGGWVDGWIK